MESKVTIRKGRMAGWQIEKKLNLGSLLAIVVPLIAGIGWLFSMQSDAKVTSATLQSHLIDSKDDVAMFRTELRETRVELNGKLDTISERQFDLLMRDSEELASYLDETSPDQD